MPRMKPIEPWYSLYRQMDKAMKKPGDLTPRELEQANVARDALWEIAHNRKPHADAGKKLREVSDKKSAPDKCQRRD